MLLCVIARPPKYRFYLISGMAKREHPFDMARVDSIQNWLRTAGAVLPGSIPDYANCRLLVRPAADSVRNMSME